MRLLAPLFASALLAALAVASTAVAQPLSLTINNKTVLPIVRGWEAPDGGVLSLVNVTKRLSAAKNATKQAVVGGVVAPLVAGSLDDAEDVGAAAVSAQAALDKKLAAAGLPTTAALAARSKNFTVMPAKAKATAAIKNLRNATDTAAAAAWDEAARQEAAAFAFKTNVSVAAANLAEVAIPALKTKANLSSSLPSSTRPDKAAAIIAAARNMSASAMTTKRAIEDAALDSEKGKARFSVLVTIDPTYNPVGGNGFEGSQHSSSSRSGLVPVLSQLGKAKQSAIDGVKAAVNATFPEASSAKAAAASAVGFGRGSDSRSSSSVSSSSTSPVSSSVSAASATAATSSTSTPRIINPLTVLISAADGISSGETVSFSAATVRGLPGDTFFSPSAVDPFDIANAVRAMFVSKLRRLAAEGSAEASSLLSLGDSSTEGHRTAAPLLSTRGVALDPGAGVYLVSVSFPALLPGVPLPLPATKLRSQLINAVNDVSPDDPCGSLAERNGFDICNAIDDATYLTISKATLRAVESSPGGAGRAEQLLLPFGRRSKSADTARTLKLSASAAAASASATGAVSEADLAGVADPEKKEIVLSESAKYIANALGEATGLSEIGDFGGIVGELFKFAEEPSAFGFISGALSVIPFFKGLFFKEPSFNEQTLNYLSTINATTFKILEGIKVIEDSLLYIESDIRNLGDLVNRQFAKEDCNAEIREATKDLQAVLARWNVYNESSVAGPRFAIQEAMDAVSQGRRPRTNYVKVFDEWAINVLGEPGAVGGQSVRDALKSLHSTLGEIGSTEPGATLIGSCAASIMLDYRYLFKNSNSEVFAFDDRQYFNSIQKLLHYYQIWQARGAQMIQEALTFRAQQAALSGWAANQTVPGCNTENAGVDRTKCIPDIEQLPLAGSLFCARLTANSKAGKLPENQGFIDAVGFCDRMKLYVNEIADHMYAQQEFAGAPLSWGNAGEGVRLLLGSDVTGRPAQISRVATQTKTEWLVAASPESFSSYCGSTSCRRRCSAASASASACPLLGSRSKPFNEAEPGYTLGYDSTLWTPAGKEVWVNALRGMQPIPADATGYAASLLSIMETGNEARGAVPFKGIQDRVWWIHNASTDARVANFGLRGPVVPLDGGPSPSDFFAPKDLAIKNAYCFAAVWANSTLNGPSGVVCASEDFDGVFEGDCTEHSIPGDRVRDYTFQYYPHDGVNLRTVTKYLTCVMKPRDWVTLTDFLEYGKVPSALAITCPIERLKTPDNPGTYNEFGYAINSDPECGLAYYNDPTTLSQYESLYETGRWPRDISRLRARPGASCPVGAGSQAPMDVCLKQDTIFGNIFGGRLSYRFWDPNSFDAGGNQPTIPTATPPLLHRLPALKLADIQPAAKSNQSTGSCYASWDPAVPVLCGSDKTRYIVAKLGSGGKTTKVDTTSWPARGANNQTLTTAVMSVIPFPGGVSFQCIPVWRRADGSLPLLSATPMMTSRVITQFAGPVYAGEEKLTWASGSAEAGIGVSDGYSSVLGAYPSNATSSTGSNRYLPRVVTCSVKAVDPGNNGWPVYAIGSYLAVENANATGGIELRPNFSFPAV